MRFNNMTGLYLKKWGELEQAGLLRNLRFESGQVRFERTALGRQVADAHRFQGSELSPMAVSFLLNAYPDTERCA